uniref:Vitellogenin domain-containing protein n=1 Tax=Denticeps clupeoides TaxID=299321 RepID=A0AAY4ERD3_9TELE
MQGLLLCLLFSLGGKSKSHRYELNHKKTYEYKYVGTITIGHDMPDLAESGVKLLCNVQIEGVSPQTFLLQVSNVAFQEQNGVPGNSGFTSSPKMSKKLSDEITKPFVFEYMNGRVGDIKAATEVSDTVVNIVRGILGFFQVTIKSTQRVYELEESGIHGLCQSNYIAEEDEHEQTLTLHRVVDVTNCRQKAAVTVGLALASENEPSKQRGDNIVAMVKYMYTVKSTSDGGLITMSRAEEKHHLSTLNVKGGNSKLLAIKEITLLKVLDSEGTHTIGPVQSRGNIIYKFGNELKQIPIVMMNLENPVPKIVDLIKRLAETNTNKELSGASTDVIEVFQLMRSASLEDLETLWRQLSDNQEHRRWFLDCVVEVDDERVIKFLERRFQNGDVTANEATQALLLALNHLKSELGTVDRSKGFLHMPFVKSNQLLWNTAVLSYGSLVYRLCEKIQPCPVTAVQPLLDIANNGLMNKNEEAMVLALKALGNAGHPSGLKTVIKFLPGISANAVDLPTRVISTAVDSLRHLARRDPHSVQDIALSLFVQKTLPAEVRMLACMILFKTRPPVALVSTISAVLLEETDLQFASFSYSLIKSLSNSRTPDNHHLSTACNIATKILAPKLERLSYFTSMAWHTDWFSDTFLAGVTNELYMLKNAADSMPTTIIGKGKFHIIGRIIEMLELGVSTDGIKTLLSQIDILTHNYHFYSVNNLLNIQLADWQSFPNSKPLFSGYARVYGQEVFFSDVNKEVLQQAIDLNEGKDESPLRKFLKGLEEGALWHWTKPYLAYETRFIQATCLGLPVEISKYYLALTAVTANVKAQITPPVQQHVMELFTSEVSLETNGHISITKDIFAFHGINTELFQFGSELKCKANVNIPWKFMLNMNGREKKFELDISPYTDVTEVFSFTSDVYAVSRNIAEPSFAKRTPIIPITAESLDVPVHGLESIDPVTGSPDQWLPTTEPDFHLTSQFCAESSKYGTAICMEAQARRAHFFDEYPLSCLAGYSHVAIQLKPIEKIQIQISAGPTKTLLNQIVALVRKLIKRNSEVIINPVVVMKALALSDAAKPEGFTAAVYSLPAAQKDNIQFIVSEVGEDANWKMCTETSHARRLLSVHFRWGAECQSYELTVNVARIQEPSSKPTLSAKVNWGNLPMYMNNFGKSLEELLPFYSYLIGLHSQPDANPDHEFSAKVFNALPNTGDIIIKTPKVGDTDLR